MNLHQFATSRRVFLGTLGAAFFTTRGLFADELSRTPSLTEGPFYPDKLPLDTDNDLIIVSDHLTPAVGEITQLSGRVLDANGAPIKDALVEIWQCDGNAVYLHTSDSGRKQDQQDKNFQGYGKFETASDGGYRFRTIKPVPYPGRPAGHIHYKISRGGREVLTSQIFVDGAEGNRQDGVFSGLRDPLERALCMAEFNPIPESKTGELAARFDIVIGRTPDERTFER